MKTKLFLTVSLGLCLHIGYSQKTFFPKKSTEPNNEVKNSFFKKSSNTKEDYQEVSLRETKIEDSIINASSLIYEKNERSLDSLKKDSLFNIQNKRIKFSASPLENGKITSAYSNNRFHPVLKKWSAHKGTDFAAPYGTPIEATAGGIVETTGYTKGNGNFVKIKHNDTYTTQYLHMSKILVKQNQIIKKGAKIGLVGSSGYATGPHVCYRFWVDGVQVDPFAVNIATVEKKHLSKTHIVPSVTEEENEKDFKNFVSGFFKQKTTED